MGVRHLWHGSGIVRSKRSQILLVSLLATFLLLGILVRYSVLQPADIHFSRELQEKSALPINILMLVATALGSVAVVLPLAVVAAALSWFGRHRRAALFILLTLLSIPIDELLKLIWARARPDEGLVTVMVDRTGFSFPSGHALVGTSFYGMLAVLTWIHLIDHKERLPIALTLAAIPILIDTSRVYLGAHWLSDVIGGSTVGLMLLVVLASAYGKDSQELEKGVDLKS